MSRPGGGTATPCPSIIHSDVSASPARPDSRAIELRGVTADGETVTIDALADLTIHGVARSLTFPLEAQLVRDTIVVVGATGVTFSDFDVEMPRAPIVVSVEDTGLLELQLVFSRGPTARAHDEGSGA